MTVDPTSLASAADRLTKYNLDPYSETNPYGLAGVGGADNNIEGAFADVATVGLATAERAAAAKTSQDAADADAQATAADRQAVATDKTATHADRLAADADAQATAADRQAVATDKAVVHADRLAADADAQATAADRQAVATDKAVVHADRLAAYADAQATAADRQAVATDKAVVHADRLAADAAAAAAQTWNPASYVPKAGGSYSGAVGIVAGAAASPGLTVAGDPRTGLAQLHGADSFSIVGGGLERLCVLANGAIGIGTGAPGAELEVADATGDNDVRINLRASAAAFGQIGCSTTAMFVDTVGPRPYQIFVGGLEGLRVPYVAGANRCPTISPSNGGNPAIGTSGGDLNLTSATGVVRLNGVALTAGGGSGTFTSVSSKSANYSVLSSDGGGVISATAAITLTLPAASGLAPNWWITLSNRSTGTVQIVRTGSDTINGVPGGFVLRSGEDITVYRSSSSAFDVLMLGRSVTEGQGAWDPAAKGADITLSNNNLTATSGGAADHSVRATVAASAGKRYFEVPIIAATGARVGLMPHPGIPGASLGVASNGYAYGYDGRRHINGSAGSYGSSFSNGSILRVAVDFDAGKLFFGIGAVWQGGADPVTGANPAVTGLTGMLLYPAFGRSDTGSSSATLLLNLSSFNYSPPAGYTTFY